MSDKETPHAHAVNQKVADHVRRKETDLKVCLERTERFVDDLSPIISLLQEMAGTGACDSAGRPIGWVVEPVAPEDTKDYKQKAYFCWENVLGGVAHFRPCQVRIGFLDDHGTLVNQSCVITRTVNGSVHSEKYEERTGLAFPHGSQVWNDFMDVNGDKSKNPKTNKFAHDIGGYDDIKRSYYDPHGHREEGWKEGFRVVIMPSGKMDWMASWVRRAVLAKVDPAKTAKPEASQELADKRAEAMMKLATIAAASTCGRTPADIKEAYTGEPAPDAKKQEKNGWFNKVLGR